MRVASGAFHHFREDASVTCCCGGAAKAHEAFVASMWRSTCALAFLTIYVCASAAMTVASKARFAVPSSFGGVGQQNVPQLRPLNILFLMADQMRFGKLFEKLILVWTYFELILTCFP